MGDFDTDGDLDVFLPIYSGENGVHILLNNGAGLFDEQINILEMDVANYFVSLGDLNGNKQLDAFVTSIFHMDGNGIWLNQHVEIGNVSATHSYPTFSGAPIVFTATGSSNANAVYKWDFGDGSSGEGAVVQHVYKQCGNFTAVVTSTNTSQVEIATTTISISAPQSLFLPLLVK